MTVCIALVRGINVGRAKRVPMQILRELLVEMGHANVRTLLNSGNVVFVCGRANTAGLARSIEVAVAARCGVTSDVVVITAAELHAIVAENPVGAIATDPARHLVGFATSSAMLDAARELAKKSWVPDAIAVTRRAAYLWCSAGVLDSPLSKAFARVTKKGVTARNWTTVLKLQTLVGTMR